MSTERLVRQALENSVKDLPCPEPDIEQLLAAGRAARRRRVATVASLAAAAVLVIVLAGLSFAWAGRTGQALEPVPANPTTSASIGSAFTSEQQKWIDALPAGAPPSTPYWHDGTLYVNGTQIPAPYKGVDLTVAGDTLLVGGYQEGSVPYQGSTVSGSNQAEANDAQWGIVRGGRLEELPVPRGAHVGLSVDGRIAYWVEHHESSVQFFTWDTETNTALASHTLQRGDEAFDGREILGVDATGSGYWKASLSDPYLIRWDIRTNTLHPTDMTYDTMQGIEQFDGFLPWMHAEDKYRSPDGTREVFTDPPAASSCCNWRMRVRPVGQGQSAESKEAIALLLPTGTPKEPLPWSGGNRDAYWVWWEADDSVLLTVDGDTNTYLVRCSPTGGVCERVVDLGTDTPQTDGEPLDWENYWGFARAPLSD